MTVKIVDLQGCETHDAAAVRIKAEADWYGEVCVLHGDGWHYFNWWDNEDEIVEFLKQHAE